MRVRIDMIVDVPDELSYGEIEDAISSAIMLAEADFDVCEIMDIEEI